ncbi:hypothetical protein GCM10027578_00240 [Spirosoma luteolum]
MKTIHSVTILVLLAVLTLAQSTQAQQRRRWSPQAKGAVIGGAAGGAVGAIINKRNRVVGGLIGGAVGTAAGYGIGKAKDNRNKAEAARVAALNRAAEAEQRARLAEAKAERARIAAANAAPKHGFGVSRPAAVAAARTAAVPVTLAATTFAATSGFLPNTSMGNSDAPYSSSEYRRKSW